MSSPHRGPASGSARRWRIASGFCAVVTFTVVAGYYVPLHREAKGLRSSLALAMEDRATLKRSLEQSERLLTESRGHLQELDAKVEAAKNVSPEIQQRIERLSQSLSTQFARLARAKMLNISSARDRVSIAAAVPALFAPRSAEVTAEGRDLLCQLSKAIMAEYGGELRVTGYYGQPRVEDRELAGLQITPWARSATRAASAADVLQNGCGAPTERLLVVAYGPRAAGPLGENVALEFIFRPVD